VSYNLNFFSGTWNETQNITATLTNATLYSVPPALERVERWNEDGRLAISNVLSTLQISGRRSKESAQTLKGFSFR